MPRAPQSLAGQLLVSHPQLRDENFCETVILLHSHLASEGAMGVVLNRPLGRLLGQTQSEFSDSPLASIALHQGGPVGSDRLAFGGWSFPAAGPAELRYGLDQAHAVALVTAGGFQLFGFIGYAGWSPGQLEGELSQNAWVLCPFEREFAAFEGIELWKKLLERHRPDLRLEADSPENPGLN